MDLTDSDLQCLTDVSPLCHSQAWLNEKFSPELLENKSEVVECVMEQLTHMVNTINTSLFMLRHTTASLQSHTFLTGVDGI